MYAFFGSSIRFLSWMTVSALLFIVLVLFRFTFLKRLLVRLVHKDIDQCSQIFLCIYLSVGCFELNNGRFQQGKLPLETNRFMLTRLVDAPYSFSYKHWFIL